MKTVSLLIYCFLSLFVHAQSDPTIIGKWTVVSMSRDGIHYNLKKDSISFSKEFMELQSSVSGAGTSQQKIIAETLKIIASNFSVEFRRDNKFRFVMDSNLFVVYGNYKEVALQKIIKLSNKKSLGLNDFDIADTMSYMIKNNLLYLSIDEDDEEFEFILEKGNTK